MKISEGRKTGNAVVFLKNISTKVAFHRDAFDKNPLALIAFPA